jgi:hypothetical protein
MRNSLKLSHEDSAINALGFQLVSERDMYVLMVKLAYHWIESRLLQQIDTLTKCQIISISKLNTRQTHATRQDPNAAYLEIVLFDGDTIKPKRFVFCCYEW